MKETINIIFAEIIKQHKNSFHSYILYVSLAFWPIINFFHAYYAYKPFESLLERTNFFTSYTDLILFLVIGFWGWLCFWSLVQSAIEMNLERESGTLEIIFLSPVNRLVLVYGRTLGSLIENIWLFTIFSVIIFIIYSGKVPPSFFWKLPIVSLIMLISAILWGGFMNVIFLATRDAGIFYTITTEPMLLFSGARIPTSFFPFWFRIIASIFPLTYTLGITRYVLFNLDVGQPIIIYMGVFICILVVLFVMTFLLLKIIEKRQLNNGTLFLF